MKLRRWVLGEILIPPAIGKEKATPALCNKVKSSPFRDCFFIGKFKFM